MLSTQGGRRAAVGRQRVLPRGRRGRGAGRVVEPARRDREAAGLAVLRAPAPLGHAAQVAALRVGLDAPDIGDGGIRLHAFRQGAADVAAESWHPIRRGRDDREGDEDCVEGGGFVHGASLSILLRNFTLAKQRKLDLH